MNVYPATKYGVTAFTEVVRRELAETLSRIRITSISPGLVATEIFEANKADTNVEINEFLKSSPRMKPEDVADSLIYALGAPGHVQIAEIIIIPTGEKL